MGMANCKFAEVFSREVNSLYTTVLYKPKTLESGSTYQERCSATETLVEDGTYTPQVGQAIITRSKKDLRSLGRRGRTDRTGQS